MDMVFSFNVYLLQTMSDAEIIEDDDSTSHVVSERVQVRM